MAKNNKNASTAAEDVTGMTKDNLDKYADDIKDQKIASADTSHSPSAMKEEVIPKNVFNTKKAAELVGNGAASMNGSAGALANAARVISYSGGADAVGGDGSSMLKSDKPTKSGDRPGRQIDTPLQHIDDATAEVYQVPIDTIPMLKDGNSNVGYNGNYRNAHKVSQKGAGGSPADADFFRTLDEMQYDNVYFGEGQLNRSVMSDGFDTTSLTVDTWNPTGGSSGEGAHDTKSVSLGNYLSGNLQVTFNGNGAVTSMSINQTDIKPDAMSEYAYRVAGDVALREANISELDRLEMINKAGDETAENWSPLGKVIPHSRDTNRFMKELDLSIGDTCLLSQAKLAHALSYQNNKAAKDGLRKVGPMFEMCYGDIDGNSVRHTFAGEDENLSSEALFSAASATTDPIQNGSAALFIALMDSTPKYNTKGKMLSLPLSFKSALSTARSNSGSLRAHKQFLDELNRQEAFGKIDEDGSGITPYFISDGAKVCTTVRLDEGINNTGTATVVDNSIITHFEDQRNKYNIPCYNYFAKGLLQWFNRYGAKIKSKLKANDGSYTLTVPITSTTCAISLWDLIVCAAMKDIAAERKYAMDLVLQYESLNGVYPYTGSILLKDADVENRSNIGFVDIAKPLQPRNIPLTTGLRLLLPETLDLLGTVKATNTKLKVRLPWYFNQNQFDVGSGSSSGTKWIESDNGLSNNTYFDFRGGVTFGNADRIKAMDPEQIRLCMDRMITIPCQSGIYATGAGFKAEVYKFSQHEDGIPIVNYTASALTILSVLKTPRELGLSFVAPAGICTPTYSVSYSGSTKVCKYKALTDQFIKDSGSSFRCRIWHAASTMANTLFGESQTSLVRLEAVNYKAKYDVIEATADFANASPNSNGIIKDFGISLSASNANGNSTYTNYLIPIMQVAGSGLTYDSSSGTYNSSESAIVPGTTTLYASAYTGWVSSMKYLFNRLQYLPFILNPFDSNNYKITGSESNETWYVSNETDAYDFMHLFNLCGFRAGEYSGTEYERNKARIELGLNYVNDPYIDARL